jgi:hypothetical protein
MLRLMSGGTGSEAGETSRGAMATPVEKNLRVEEAERDHARVRHVRFIGSGGLPIARRSQQHGQQRPCPPAILDSYLSHGTFQSNTGQGKTSLHPPYVRHSFDNIAWHVLGRPH